MNVSALAAQPITADSGVRSGNAPRVLLVEDEEADRVVVERILKSVDAVGEVRFASSAATAFDVLSDQPIDAIVLDCSLPDMSGEDFLQKLGTPLRNRIAIVVLTGAGGEEIAATMLKKGADDYLPKSTLSATGLERALINSLERVRLAAKLRRQQLALERGHAQFAQFTKAASHDLQEPLRTVSSFCQLLSDDYADELDERGREFVRHIVAGAHRMTAMISCLKQLTRLDRNLVAIESCDLDVLSHEVIDSLQAMIDGHNAVVSVDDLPTLRCDRDHIALVLQNLIANGIKFNQSEQPQVHITARRVLLQASDHDHADTTLLENSAWQVAVRDNGIGIEPRFRERVFQLFQRLHTAEQYPGTGMGLALCRQAIANHRGRIWIDPAAGNGTAVVFTLPSTATESQCAN